MQIIEIRDLLNPKTTAENKREVAVGIDFGTTYSLIAVSQQKRPIIIKDVNNKELIPTVVSLTGDSIIVGEHQGLSNIKSIKRLLGKSTQEIIQNPILNNLVPNNLLDGSSNIPKIKLNGQSTILPNIAAEIFKYLKTQAEMTLSLNVAQAVVTVPSYFDDAAKGEVMLAARIAGLEVIRLMNEPTAAAYAYGFNKETVGCYLIYDFGGGTFDVSVLHMQAGILQVISTAGNNMLGGDDIDHLVAKYLSDNNELPYSQALLKAAKEIKEQLTTAQQAILEFGDVTLTLGRSEFEQLILPLVNDTIAMVSDTLQQANNPLLTGIVLVGGSSRIPLITTLLTQSFATTIFSDIDPDRAVAYGAALQAENLISNSLNSLLIDVVPLSLGLELYGGTVEKVILRNSPIPISVTKEFTTYMDNQTAMQFHIVQGEREVANDCRSLARFELQNLPTARAGQVKVIVTFSVDADGILSVSALEESSGRSHIVNLKPTYGLDAEATSRLLEEAYSHTKEDHHKKLLRETIVEAESLIHHLEQVIKEIRETISAEILQQLQQTITVIKDSIDSEDVESITDNYKILQQIAEPLISSRIDYAVKKYLKGKHIAEV